MKDETITEDSDLLATRASLLIRLKDLSDEESWRDFFDTYWRLLLNTAIGAGLHEDEAQDVVQEVMVTVTKNIKNFRYDAGKGKFKGWLLNITRWRIADQFRKRLPIEASPQPSLGETTLTPRIERIPDPESLVQDKNWDVQWKKNLLHAALERIRPKIRVKDFEIFDVYVLKGWPVEKVVQSLAVSADEVYLVKHRVTAVLKKEIKKLEVKYG